MTIVVLIVVLTGLILVCFVLGLSVPFCVSVYDHHGIDKADLGLSLPFCVSRLGRSWY